MGQGGQGQHDAWQCLVWGQGSPNKGLGHPGMDTGLIWSQDPQDGFQCLMQAPDAYYGIDAGLWHPVPCSDTQCETFMPDTVL